MDQPLDLRLRKVGDLWIVEGPERPHRPWLRAEGWRWDGSQKEWWTNRQDLADELAELIKPDYTQLPPELADTEEEQWLRERIGQ